MGIDQDDFGKVNNGVPGKLEPWVGGFTPVVLTDQEKREIPASKPAVGPLVPIERDEPVAEVSQSDREELVNHGERILKNMVDNLYGADEKLRLGADHYLHNYDVGHDNYLYPSVDVGITPVLETLGNGLDGDSEHAAQMRDTAERVHQGVDGVVADFEGLTNISGPNGRSTAFYEEVISLYRQMTGAESEGEARHFADQIRERVGVAQWITLVDVDRVNLETQAVETVTSTAYEEFQQWRRGYAERANGAGVDTLNSFQMTLGRLAEISHSKGEDFRVAIKYVPQMVENMDGQWQTFVDKYFANEE